MSDGALRLVSGLERAWLVGGRLYPPFAIHMVLEAPAPLDPDRWSAAIATAAARWPGLRVRLAGWLRSARWIAEERPLPVVVTAERWAGDRPHALLDGRLLPGPGARAVLFPADGRAVFSAHHAITDGRGLRDFVADVVRVLGGEPPRGAAGGPLIDAELARRVGATAERDTPKSDARSPFGDDADDRPGLTWRRRRLPIRRGVVARAMAATVAAAGHRLTLGIPVDLRRHLPPADSALSANLTGVARLVVEPDADLSAIRAALDAALDGRAAERHALSAEGLRGLPLWLMTAIARASARRAGLRPDSAVISSLGRHDLRLDGRPLRLLFIPPGSEGLPLFMGLSGDADGIEVAAVCPQARVGDGARLEPWLDRFVDAFATPDSAR